jgi:hypothetical protein
MNRRALVAGAAVALGAAAALGAARPAAAYVRTITDKDAAVKWPRACVVVTAHIANPPPNLTPEMATAAAIAAAAAWTAPAVTCTGFSLQIATENTSDAPVANDHKNNLVFRTSAWEYDRAALAITTVFAQQIDGVILDADVELNAVPFATAGGGTKQFRWGDLVGGVGVEGSGVEDLQNTLTHEFGHLLGLDHNCFLSGTGSRRLVDDQGVPVPECDRATTEIQQATMFAAVAPGDIERRTLTEDDIKGVCAIYPPASAATCTEDPGGGGGCVLAGRAAHGGGLPLALVAGAAVIVVSARRRRGRRLPRG